MSVQMYVHGYPPVGVRLPRAVGVDAFVESEHCMRVCTVLRTTAVDARIARIPVGSAVRAVKDVTKVSLRRLTLT